MAKSLRPRMSSRSTSNARNDEIKNLVLVLFCFLKKTCISIFHLKSYILPVTFFHSLTAKNFFALRTDVAQSR